MTGFLVLGVVLTLVLLAGGAFAWRRMDQDVPGTASKRRHREEARQLQAWLDADADFVQNFHHPTQNEVLETLQALDFLTPDWDEDSVVLTEGRLKNELAESFPALRRDACAYPRPIASDVAQWFDKARLSPEALEDNLRAYAARQAERRAGFHVSRARANARHQMSAGPAVGPVTLAPGSLPFRVREEKRTRRFAWVGPVAGVAALATAGVGAYLYANAHPGVPGGREENKPGVATIPAPASTPTPVPALSVPAAALSLTTPAPAPQPADQPAEPAPTAAESTPATPAPAAPPVATADTQAAFAQKVAESQLRAVDKYPQLAVPNSEINLRFVFRYKNLVDDQSPRLQDPNWPEKLADECARSTGTGGKGKKPVPPVSTRR